MNDASDSDSDDDMIFGPLIDLDEPSESLTSSEADAEDSESEAENKTSKRTDNHTNEDDNANKPLMSLRQRRRSRGAALTLNIISNIRQNDTPVKKHWKLAVLKARKAEDPWEEFHIDKLKTEMAIRHRYNALKHKWCKDEVTVKMQLKSFNRGAMRQCYRLKKLSNFTNSGDWRHTANYVAKRYMEDVDRDVYFDDVRLQMDAKLWGEEYNRHNPPKKVDIFQMYVLEFKDREGSPLYHLEHFIEGNYIKYNSNSGFVEETSRLTPQAFSHFTFERSGHQLIVVDIQGVGDLYTDPQIHTQEGKDYGDGNLGTKGMALFFHSHVCNEICESLALTQFDMADSERKIMQKYIALLKSSMTHVRGDEEMCISASPRDQVDLTEFLRQRTISSSSNASMNSVSSGVMDSPRFELGDDNDTLAEFSPTNLYCDSDTPTPTTSENDTLSKEEERRVFSNALQKMSRPSSVAHEMNLRSLNNRRVGDSILGQVHHELARYHEIGRFKIDPKGPDTEIDWGAAMYHEEVASKLGVMEAILTLAKLYLGLQRNVLASCSVEQSGDNANRGVDYMVQAARAGDRTAMIYMANAYQTGLGLGTERTPSYSDALYWYDKALSTSDHDESGEYDATADSPTYILLANKAQLYFEGGTGLDKDPRLAGDTYNEAAEDAMAAMKGRLANKYYGLAEEAFAMLDEE